MEIILINLAIIFVLDILSFKVTQFLTSSKQVHHNARWFFIHFVVNTFVTFSTFSDLKYCLINQINCSLIKASDEAQTAITLMLVMHLYHMIFFFKHLKRDDWIHHILMCGFNGYVFHIQRLKIQSVTSFFCSGLPGMIDYFLLYLYKIGYLDIKYEKEIYYYISIYLRSPGCMLNCFLAIPYFTKERDHTEWYLYMMSILLVFWNGQYYMSKTCTDYGKKIILNKNVVYRDKIV